MKYRYVTLLEPEDLGASGTKVIDIKLLDCISRITIVFSATNGSAGVSDHPAANVQKIELVDGSEVLYSLSGMQAQGIDFYQAGRLPYDTPDASNGAGQGVGFHINFGRYLWDSDFVFDPKKFRNPQLRITYDETISNADCTENKCFVFASVFDEMTPSATGMLRQMEQYTYGLPAGGKQYVTLPVDHKLREIYVQCLERDKWVSQNIGHFKLSEDQAKRVPVDLDYWPLATIVWENDGMVVDLTYAPSNTAEQSVYVAPSDYPTVDGAVPSGLTDLRIHTMAGGQITYANETADEYNYFNIAGLFPHAVVPILNVRDNDPGNWYDVSGIKNLDLILTHPSGATDGHQVSVLTEQAYYY